MQKTDRKYRVVVAEGQFLIREAFRSLFSGDGLYCLAGEADSLSELMKGSLLDGADLLITDPGLFSRVQYGLLSELAHSHPRLSIMVLTPGITREEVLALTKSGVYAIVYKTAGKEEILAAFQAALNKKNFFCEKVMELLIHPNGRKHSIRQPEALTRAELRIVELVASGLTTKQIAEKIRVSYHTVMSHRKNIFRKLGVNNASEMVMHALRAGWIDTIEYHI